MTGTNCDLFAHKQSQSYLNHLVQGMSFASVFNNFQQPNQIKSTLKTLFFTSYKPHLVLQSYGLQHGSSHALAFPLSQCALHLGC
jgi:hypothetical protein